MVDGVSPQICANQVHIGAGFGIYFGAAEEWRGVGGLIRVVEGAGSTRIAVGLFIIICVCLLVALEVIPLG